MRGEVEWVDVGGDECDSCGMDEEGKRERSLAEGRGRLCTRRGIWLRAKNHG